MGGFGFTYQKLQDYSNKFNFNIKTKYFIETGTNTGKTVCFMQPHFEKVWSIELSQKLYNGFLQQAKSYGNVTTFLGPSEEVLPELCKKAEGNAIFYLDAHYCYGTSAKGISDCPLIEEIKAIKERKYDDIIICDDLMYFSKVKQGLDWQHVTVEKIKEILGEDKSYIEHDDRLIIF